MHMHKCNKLSILINFFLLTPKLLNTRDSTFFIYTRYANENNAKLTAPSGSRF